MGRGRQLSCVFRYHCVSTTLWWTKQVDELVQCGQSVWLSSELPTKLQKALLSGQVSTYLQPRVLRREKMEEWTISTSFSESLNGSVHRWSTLYIYVGWRKGAFLKGIPEIGQPSFFYTNQCSSCSCHSYSCKQHLQGNNILIEYDHNIWITQS